MFTKIDYSAIKPTVAQVASEAILVVETMGEGIEAWATCLEAAIMLTNRAFGDLDGEPHDFLYDLAIGSALLATKMQPQWFAGFNPTGMDVFADVNDFKNMAGHIALRIQESLVEVNMLSYQGNSVAATEAAARLVSDCIVILVNCASLNGATFKTSYVDEIRIS